MVVVSKIKTRKHRSDRSGGSVRLKPLLADLRTVACPRFRGGCHSPMSQTVQEKRSSRHRIPAGASLHNFQDWVGGRPALTWLRLTKTWLDPAPQNKLRLQKLLLLPIQNRLYKVEISSSNSGSPALFSRSVSCAREC